MAGISTLVAKYRVVTPLMVGGANHAPELRLASYANMVRWWWRFLALGRFGDAAIASFWEAVLFGWHEKPFGQKRVRFTLKSQSPGTPEGWSVTPNDWRNWSGVQYLTAQGFKEGRYPVQAKDFEVEVGLTDPQILAFEQFRDDPKVPGDKSFVSERLEGWKDEWPTARDTFVDAMELIGLIGGLGARSRRGFGSLAIESLTGDPREPAKRPTVSIPANVEAYKAMISACLGPKRFSGEPPYTALSDKTQIQICATLSGGSLGLMNEIGWAFQIYRSWGNTGGRQPHLNHFHEFKSGGQHGPTLAAGAAKAGWYRTEFQADHNGFYQTHPGIFPVAVFDKRSVFGLPHNYGRTQIGWTDGTKDLKRRASPLLMHFHPLADGGHAAVVMSVPAVFSPSGSQLEVRPNGPTPNPRNLRGFPASTDWALIEGFAGFVIAPPGGASGGAGGGVIHTSYAPVAEADGAVP